MGMMGQFLVVDPNASLEELNESTWNMYPNPSSGVVNFESEFPETLILWDATGKMIQQIEVVEHTSVQLKVDAGIYYVSDQNGNARKLVIH
jgi:hypothetical protein